MGNSPSTKVAPTGDDNIQNLSKEQTLWVEQQAFAYKYQITDFVQLLKQYRVFDKISKFDMNAMKNSKICIKYAYGGYIEDVYVKYSML